MNGGLKQLVSSQGGKAFKRNGLVMQREGKDRLPVKVFHSNSVPKMVEKYIRAREEWQEHLKSRYSQTFARTSKQRSRRLWGKQ